jgi:hypothetical protein
MLFREATRRHLMGRGDKIFDRGDTDERAEAVAQSSRYGNW